MTTFGKLNLTIQSLSTLSASFELSLNCSKEIKPMSSQTFTVLPKQSVNISFTVFTETQLHSNHTCLATLLSSVGTELHTQTIYFSTEETKFTGKLAIKATAPQFNSSTYQNTFRTAESLKKMDCEQLCPNTANVFCQIVNVWLQFML